MLEQFLGGPYTSKVGMEVFSELRPVVVRVLSSVMNVDDRIYQSKSRCLLVGAHAIDLILPAAHLCHISGSGTQRFYGLLFCTHGT